MEIASIRHKALKRLDLTGQTKGAAEPQRLTGDRKGSFAMTVTRNWHLTFGKVDARSIADLDLEDYH